MTRGFVRVVGTLSSAASEAGLNLSIQNLWTFIFGRKDAIPVAAQNMSGLSRLSHAR